MSVVMNDVEKWYHNHKITYDSIENDLSTVRRKFETASMPVKRAMLMNSYYFAVISIQTTVERHEEAFEKFTNRQGLPESLESVVYPNQKSEWITRTEKKRSEIDKVISHIENEDIDKAHRHMVDEFVGVSTVKSAFVLCMLGYTSKACIDTNILNFIDGEIEVYDGVVISKYDEFCEKALDIEGLEDKDLFMKQWITFDYMRNTIEQHEVYFDEQMKV